MKRPELVVELAKADAERLSELIARVDQRRQRLGLSERACALKAGLSVKFEP
jgi:hypothetical protein